jgi:hypothetical protein
MAAAFTAVSAAEALVTGGFRGDRFRFGGFFGGVYPSYYGGYYPGHYGYGPCYRTVYGTTYCY